MKYSLVRPAILHRKYILEAVATILLCASSAHAEWIRTGPGGGLISSLTVIGSMVFASTDSGVVRSRNMGQTWERCPLELPGLIGSCGSALYSGDMHANLFRSLDGGDHWDNVTIQGGLGSTMLIVGQDNRIFFSPLFQLYCSTNTGATWTLENYDHNPSPGFGGSVTKAIGCDHDVILVGTDQGLYRTTNNGSLWGVGNYGMTNDTVTGLAFAHGKWYAGTSGGIFISQDSGLSWIRDTQEMLRSSVTKMTNSGDTIVASSAEGIIISVDGGENWFPFSSRVVGVTALAFVNQTVFVGTQFGILSSSDPDQPWLSWNYEHTATPYLAFDSTGIIVSTGEFDSGLFCSRDGIGQWDVLNKGLTADYYYSWLAIKHLAIHGDEIIVRPELIRGVYITSDRGATWQNSGTLNGLPNCDFPALGFCGGQVFAGGLLGLFRSSDNGTTWQRADVGIATHSFSSLVEHNGTLYAACDNVSVYRTSDNGNHWTPLGIPDKLVTDIAFSPNHLFAATSANGVYRSDDDGNHWFSLYHGMPTSGIRSVRVADSTLFAGTDSGLFVSSNWGNSWTSIPTNGVTRGIQGLAVQSNRIVFANDAGEIWERSIDELVGVHEQSAQTRVTSFALQGSPNPFTQSVSISFFLASSQHASVALFDCLGRCIHNLTSQTFPPGSHEVKWQPVGMSPGTYLCRLTVGLRHEFRSVYYMK